ncbi:hypothetical protein AB3N58_17430 (plasmid) [Leptospira sp. WS60.C2]
MVAEEIALEFLRSCGKFEILDTWHIHISKNEKRICYQIISSINGQVVGILNDMILSDYQLLKIWLRNTQLGIAIEDFDIFRKRHYPHFTY